MRASARVNQGSLEMKYRLLPSLVATVLATTLVGCDNSGKTKVADTAASAATITEVAEKPPAAPAVAYESVIISNDEAGPFKLEGSGINYLSRAGVVNVLEGVLAPEVLESPGYVTIEKAYAFAGNYVLIISTGESGNSCPATTYVFSYDTKSESITGKTEVDGCSETLDSFADGNKLNVKKEGKTTTVYNGVVIEEKS